MQQRALKLLEGLPNLSSLYSRYIPASLKAGPSPAPLHLVILLS